MSSPTGDSNTNPLHAGYYADRAVYELVDVIENVRLARDTYRVRIGCPELARRITPGQFVMLRLARCDDPLLARPMALYDTVLGADGEPTGIDVVYRVMGKMTGLLAAYRRGEKLEIWGPLGNGFRLPPTDHLVMVAGGIGQTPFLALAREALGERAYGDPPRATAPVDRVTFCYGVRNAEFAAGVSDFSQAGVRVEISSDDGTLGQHGLVTDLLRAVLEESHEGVLVVCCGPEPMMEAVSQITSEAGVPCQVSLETPMACGIGICFSCVARVRLDDGQWDYKRTCVEGPVFDAEKIVW